ncbi:hypothetical protein F5B20DRAFT_594986 [Whalleya microplaca]|nr:hypothetical protein F5B20DRAFT_594986 [Whalleya microplaca]
MGVQQPYLYDDDRRDSRLPDKPFEPKAITRASWEPKPRSPKKQDGPLIAFNRHPDAHEVLTPRTFNFRPMSSTTKSWIKWTRYVQIGLRLLEMVGGVCLLVLMILISNVDTLTSWVMRITPGATAISCVYAMWHLSRHAGSRPPTSSAAYQAFAAFTDLAVLPLYAFGAISVENHGSEWQTIFASSKVLNEYLVQAEYYTLFSAGGLHIVSLCISVYLALMFRRIANMPPDMNPLEDHLTSRVSHKRNKSSMASSYTAISETSKRLSTPLENHRSSGAPYEDLSRPPSIPFMHTRSGSRDSVASVKRDSRSDLPSRQYQITFGNSPRNSTALPEVKSKHMSAPPRALSQQRGSYTEIPLRETNAPGSPSPSASPTRPSSVIQPHNASPTRVAKFTEAWYTSDSLINRTQQRQRAMNAAEKRAQQGQKPRQYEALSQRYALNDDDSDDDSDRENDAMRADSDLDSDSGDEHAPSSPINVTGALRPHPLRLNPTPAAASLTTTTPPQKKSPLPLPRERTPFRPRSPAALAEVVDLDLNARRGRCWGNSSIQTNEDAFYAKPYGELKPATPPIMVGGARQVSSGNDYDIGSGGGNGGGLFGRRNVSGKVAEEGLAGAGNKGGAYSRYSVLND